MFTKPAHAGAHRRAVGAKSVSGESSPFRVLRTPYAKQGGSSISVYGAVLQVKAKRRRCQRFLETSFALKDGKHYLIEQYRISLWRWRATLASRIIRTSIGRRRLGSTATLPAVGAELAGIITTKPGALARSKPLEQKRQAGLWAAEF